MNILTNDLSEIKAKYDILEVLGSGAFGIVRKCRNRQTGELAAVKTIEKARVDNLQNMHREIELLKEVHHPHIIELYDIYENTFSIHLVTELCSGGELYDKVVEKAESEEGHFSEVDASILVRDILDGIRYCHDELNIVHRDLKPENFLLKNKQDDAPLKIIDFGLSRRNDAPFGLMKSRVGTCYYVAPEVLNGDYTYKCDIWSIGVIAYILLCGFAPFAGEDDIETMSLVQNARLDFPSPEWDAISEDAKDFVTKLLQRESFTRPTAAEALRLPWVAQHVLAPGLPPARPFVPHHRTVSGSGSGGGGGSVLRQPSLSSSSSSSSYRMTSVELRLDSSRRTAFQKFLADLKVKKAMNGAVHMLTGKEAKHLGDVFRKVDKDQDGRITPGDLDAAVQSDSFSSSVKQNLKEMKAHLSTHPRFSFDIRPFLKVVDQRAKSY